MRRRGLLMLGCYCAIACGWAWSFWLSSTGTRAQPLVAGLLGAIGTFGPSVAAVVLAGWQSGRQGIRALLIQGWRWRLGRWYWVVLGLSPLILLLALTLYHAMGGAVSHPFRVNHFRVNHWMLVPVSFGLNLVLGGPLGEESGWRGFLLPLLQMRFNAVWASVIVGIVWAFWHLPLFLIPGQLQQQLPFGLFLLNTAALSILFTWIFNQTGGSVWSAILLHTSVNYWSGVMPILPQMAGSVQPFAIAVLLIWILAILLVWQGKVAC